MHSRTSALSPAAPPLPALPPPRLRDRGPEAVEGPAASDAMGIEARRGFIEDERERRSL
ncbi:MAG: hypothetical protein J7M29_08380 [Verrucomicrobia bacterium]|nr:hypothetical protein [Verrucomicrobiota bacterium]